MTSDLGAKFGASRFDFYGSRQVLVAPQTFSPPAQMVEDTAGKRLFFAQPAGAIYANGFQLKTYDLATGEVRVFISRRGGAASPALSKDGKWLAYVHRDDQETVLILHELATGRERVLLRGLDRDRQESGAGTTYGAYPSMAWHPSGQEIVLAYGGHLHAVNVATGATRDIPFRAPVRRELSETIRFPVPQPVSGKTTTRSHRFGVRTDRGVVYEALGDLWLRNGTSSTNITKSAAIETSPAYDPATRTLYYAAWTDDSLGAVWSRAIDGSGAARKLTTLPSQYGSLTLSPDGKTLAFLRGGADLVRGQTLEGQGRFDLILIGPDRAERKVTAVDWGEGQYANFATKHPPWHHLLARRERALLHRDAVGHALREADPHRRRRGEDALQAAAFGARGGVARPPVDRVPGIHPHLRDAARLHRQGGVGEPARQPGRRVPGRLARRRLLRLDPGRQGTGVDPRARRSTRSRSPRWSPSAARRGPRSSPSSTTSRCRPAWSPSPTRG